MKRLSLSTKYILKGLMPYNKANLNLAFKPSSFFYEIEKMSSVKVRTLQSAYYRAIRSGLIEMDNAGVPRLTPKGLSKVRPYKPTRLGKGSHLLISFDIPEAERLKRSHLRLLLRELGCTKIQQSLWATKYDHRQYLTAEIEEYGLEDQVIIFEAQQLDLK